MVSLISNFGLLRRIYHSNHLPKRWITHQRKASYIDSIEVSDRIKFDYEPRKHIIWYGYELAKYSKNMNVAGAPKAIELIDEMKRKAKLTPKPYHYTLAISACKKSNRILDAFKLFEEFIEIYGKPSKSIVTSLVTICGNCDDKTYGLKRLEWLEDLLRIRFNFVFNVINQNARIKAYSLLSCHEKPYTILQEIVDSNENLDVSTFNALMFSCTSNSETGFLEAIKLYREMRRLGVKPDLHTYNLLIHCVRFCGIGEQQNLVDTVKMLPETADYGNEDTSSKNILDDSAKTTSLERIKLNDENKALMVNQDDTRYISLLNDNLRMSKALIAIDTSKLVQPWYRLKLLGGIEGFIESMIKDGIKPNFQTFYHILFTVPLSPKLVLKTYYLYDKYSSDCRPEIYELLIRNACYNMSNQNRLQLANYLIKQMQVKGLRPTPTVFQMLAIACATKEQGRRLIKDIEYSGLVLHPKMIVNLFRPACMSTSLEYIIWILKLCIKQNVQPDKKSIKMLEEKKILYRERLIVSEKEGLLDDKSARQLKLFSILFSKWLTNSSIET